MQQKFREFDSFGFTKYFQNDNGGLFPTIKICSHNSLHVLFWEYQIPTQHNSCQLPTNAYQAFA